MRAAAVPMLILAATLALGGSAEASTAQVDTAAGSTRLIVQGDAGSDVIDISAAGGELTVKDSAGITPGGGGCSVVSSTEFTCVTSVGGEPFGNLQLSGDGGDDALRILTPLPNDVGAGIWGGEGDDVIQGSPASDIIFPEAGADQLTALGGDDFVSAGAADENDTFDLGAGGADTVTYNHASRTGGALFVMSATTAGSGVAGTGPERDTLAGVEAFYGTDAADQFHGGLGGETVSAGAGDDELWGEDGDDVLRGGSGEDLVDGGRGDDEIEGGTQIDELVGGGDDDVVRARDDLPDAIECDGPDGDAPGLLDVVYRDAVDPSDADCEAVAPKFTGTPSIVGTVRAGSTLSVTGTATTGSPAPSLEVTWWSCEADGENCVERATAPTYVPSASDVGRFLWAEIAASNGGLDWAETDLTAAVAPALIVVDAGTGTSTGDAAQAQTQQTPSPVQTPPTPLNASAPPPMTPKQLAQALLASALRAFAGETLRTFVTDGATVPFAAEGPGTALVQVYERTAPKAIAAARKLPIASGKRVFAAAGTGAVKVRPISAGKRRLRARKSVRVVVRTVFVPRGGKPVASDKKLTLKR